MTNSPLAGASARPLASARPAQTARSIVAAAQDMLVHLAAGRRIDSNAIRTAMQSAYRGSDAGGAWDWKTAYEAVEVAQLLFMRRYPGQRDPVRESARCHGRRRGHRDYAVLA